MTKKNYCAGKTNNFYKQNINIKEKSSSLFFLILLKCYMPEGCVNFCKNVLHWVIRLYEVLNYSLKCNYNKLTVPLKIKYL